MADRNGAAQMVALGAIVNTHGIRGELRMLPHNPTTQAVYPGAKLHLRRGAEDLVFTVRTRRRHKQFLLITFDGIPSIDEAEPLIGAEVEVPADELPATAEGETYHFQLLGLEVVTESGAAVGIVDEVFTTPANDVCVVRRDDREYLIPYVDTVIREVDLERRRLVIHPLPGLLD